MRSASAGEVCPECRSFSMATNTGPCERWRNYSANQPPGSTGVAALVQLIASRVYVWDGHSCMTSTTFECGSTLVRTPTVVNSWREVAPLERGANACYLEGVARRATCGCVVEKPRTGREGTMRS